MSHGTQKGEIDGVFQTRIDELETAAEKIAQSFKNGYSDFRVWHTPTAVKDLLDPKSLDNPAWNRFNINSLYSEQILRGPGEKGGTCGDLIAMKTQNDFLAVEERAFRLRHASYARCACMMHGRFDGHGKKGKSVFSFLKNTLEAAIQAGGVSGGDE